MKYFYEKPKDWVGAGETYTCNHPRFNKCTLFRNGERGLAIIQEHFDEKRKARWWGTVEPWLAGDIYFHPEFHEFFEENADEMDDREVYPTFPVRRIMWALRMKPLRKEYWEEEL